MKTVRLRPVLSLLAVPALLLMQAPAARGTKPGTKDGRTAVAPVVKLSSEDVKKLLHTGVGVAAKMARVGAGASMVVVVSETVIVAGDAALAGVDAGTDIVESRLVMVISRNKRVLETLKREGRLRRGDREFETIMAELEEEQRALSFKSGGDFLRRAVTSREGLHAMGKVTLKHGVVGLLGKTVSGWLGLGGRVRGLGLAGLARSRAVTRPTWERADSVSRVMAQLINRLTDMAAKEAAKQAIGEDIDQYVPGLTADNSSVPTEPRPYLPMPAPPAALRALEPQYELRPAPRAVELPPRAVELPPRAVELPPRAVELPPAPRAVPVPPVQAQPPPQTEAAGATSPQPDNSGSRRHENQQPKEGEAMRQLKRIEATKSWPKP